MQEKISNPQEDYDEEEPLVLTYSGLASEIEQTASAICLAGEYLEQKLTKECLQDQSTKLCFETIADSVLTLCRIAENLNDLLASQEQELECHLQPVDLGWQYGRLLQRVQKSERLEATSLNETVSRQPACFAQADPVLADKVLLHLVSNALRCTEGGRPVQICLKPEPDAWQLCVCDDGPGIEPAVLAHIFEPFVTNFSKKNGRSNCGLGLHLAQNYCRLMGWQLRIESGPQGTCAHVLIPKADPGQAKLLQGKPIDLAFCASQDRRVDMELASL